MIDERCGKRRSSSGGRSIDVVRAIDAAVPLDSAAGDAEQRIERRAGWLVERVEDAVGERGTVAAVGVLAC